MELLKKTRKFNKLLQRGENVALTDIANLLCEVINANTYIVGRKGEVRCYSLLEDFECPVMRAKVLDKGMFPDRPVVCVDSGWISYYLIGGVMTPPYRRI